MMEGTGFDFDTCVKIQSPILSYLMMQDTIQMGNEMIQTLHSNVSHTIHNHLLTLQPSLTIPFTPLKHIDIAYNSIATMHGGDKEGLILGGSVLESRTNREFFGNYLGIYCPNINKEMKIVEKVLSHGGFKNPKAIIFSDHGLMDMDTEFLMGMYTQYPFKLTLIDLSYNKLGYLGMANLINGPKHSGFNVTNMNFSFNQLDDKSAMVVSDALVEGKLKSLKSLDISGNNITEKGEGYLVKAMNSKAVKDIVVVTQKLDKNSKLIMGSKKEKIAAYKEFIKKGQELGTYDKAIVVDKSLWGEIKNTINGLNVVSNAGIGFIKCNWSPEGMVETYAQDKITATISKTFSKVLGKLTSIDGVVSCYLEATDAAWTSVAGQKVLTHELCVIGEQEFCSE